MGSKASILAHKHLVGDVMLLRVEFVPPRCESKEALVHDFNALEAFGKFSTIGRSLC